MMNLDSLVDIVLTDAIEGNLDRCDCLQPDKPWWMRKVCRTCHGYFLLDDDGNCLNCRSKKDNAL
jgi:hypothetical protein